MREPHSDSGDINARINRATMRGSVDTDTAPLVTCFRCRADYYVAEPRLGVLRYRCQCGRVFWEHVSADDSCQKVLCVTPADRNAFERGV